MEHQTVEYKRLYGANKNKRNAGRPKNNNEDSATHQGTSPEESEESKEEENEICVKTNMLRMAKYAILTSKQVFTKSLKVKTDYAINHPVDLEQF